MSALGAAFVLALVVYRMPVQLALMSTIAGAAYGIFPIAWIVFSSILLYRLAVDTGKFEIIKDSVGGLTNDRRLQALFIAFSFGAFIEGAAGFGAPVAVAGAMLAGLGFSPFYAAGICLLANTAPVAFGSIGIPVTTLAGITGLPVLPLSAMVGRLCAMISVIIPAYLMVVMVGLKRTVEVLPAVIVCGLSFAGVQFYVSNYIGPELTDILSSLACIGSMVLVIKFWKPKSVFRLEGDQPVTATPKRHTGGEIFQAWLPYMLLVAFVLTWGEVSVKGRLDRFTSGLLPDFLPLNANILNGLNVPGLHNLITRIPPVTTAPAPYRRRFRAELADGVRHGLLSGRDRLGHPAAREASAVRRDVQGDLPPAGQADGHDRQHAGAGVPDELFRDDLDAGPGSRDDRRGLPILQRDSGVARRVPDRQRHLVKRALWQPPGDYRQRAGVESRPDRLGEFGGRGDG